MQKPRIFRAVMALTLFSLCALGIGAEWTGTISPVRLASAAVIAPLQKGLTELRDITHTTAKVVADERNMEVENAALRARLIDMESQLREAALLSAENAELREALGMARRNRSCTLHAAAVIAVLPGGGYTLDCGTVDGAAVGDAVLSEDGMVGVIAAAGAHWSELRRITDVGFSAGVTVLRTGERGIATAEAGTLRVTHFPQDCGARVGDRVITSGLGGAYPPNLLLGHIAEIAPAEDGLSCIATLRVAADEVPSRVYVVIEFEREA